MNEPTPDINKKYTDINLLETIDTIAEQFHSGGMKNLRFKLQLENSEKLINELSSRFHLENNETVIFCIVTYLSQKYHSETLSMEKIKDYCNFHHHDYYQIKKTLEMLVRKDWIRKSHERNYGKTLGKQTVYFIPEKITDSLYENHIPDVELKIDTIYQICDKLKDYFSAYIDDENTSTEELLQNISYLENLCSNNPFFATVANLRLDRQEKILLYYCCTRTAEGNEVLNIDGTLNKLFKGTGEKMILKWKIQQKNMLLFDNKVIELEKEEFKTDNGIKISKEWIYKIFGQDAFLLNKSEDFFPGVCRMIKWENIQEKELFYNPEEKRSIETISNLVSKENFLRVKEKLILKKMQEGLCVLFHGYPGTGKTETIYQIARSTQRNILLVNIHEIRDKYVGESEKKLKSVFETYANSLKFYTDAPILLFNESDALISKRIQVNSSVDQMNNILQNILLQELEEFKGILFATTNLANQLDVAFERRFLFKVMFGKPDIKVKLNIWKDKLPELNEDQLKQLAENYNFSGGQIENVARKIFLSALIAESECEFDSILKFCEEEELAKKSNRKIGY